MSYRPRTVPPASDWGRFLVRMRQARDWSATEAHEHLHEGLGLGPKSRAAYVAIEDGRPLRPREERYLREEFGGGPDPILDRDPEAGSDNRLRDQSDPADLASALVAQAASMARMLQFAIARDQSVEARIRLLEGEVRTLREQLGVEAPPGQSTPPQTEGSGQ